MNKLALASIAALLAGCATVATEYRLADTKGVEPEKLGVIVVQSDEVKIVEVDGKPFPGDGTSNFYIQPGARRILVGLHWCPGGQCQFFGSYADKPRPVCIDAKAGSQYKFSARNPGPDWLPRVTEQQGTAEAKPIEARCSP